MTHESHAMTDYAPLPASFVPLDMLDPAWEARGHGRRLAAALEGAAALRTRLTAETPVLSVRTLPLTTLLYPTRFALGGAALSPAPYVSLTHRCLLVRFRQGEATRTLLFNPTDILRARTTPYFARMIERFGERLSSLAAQSFAPLEAQLARLGLGAGDIDYLAFDHFHTQDLRGLLGTVDGRLAPRFPNATLLAPRAEWEQWDDLHPMQRAWFVAEGRAGVETGRVCLTDGDLLLGEGVALVRTPGHTVGNQTLFLKTDRGVWGCSENGTCADNWSARHSRIAGVANAARQGDLDVILNSNTPEYGADQYTSMMIERTVVDPVAHNPEFVQMFSSSEVTPTAIAPGLSPSYEHRRIEHGPLPAAPPAPPPATTHSPGGAPP